MAAFLRGSSLGCILAALIAGGIEPARMLPLAAIALAAAVLAIAFDRKP